ncbi:CxxH/CxxC protein (TIGR04129 family) [Tumebacillus sp. BK434]|uniref:CxxH/CxxC protein n=1 Tax=Tumebacillus sp. BK434 TaxID=2512169 RepID=UPI001044A459|nr:CxxH/CxxC protein [Tumebacillus sp. BK434]TCP52553.1 CxxH/CxxC protein (TIGR04129 family) [Tumebacillus sp. BK434]
MYVVCKEHVEMALDDFVEEYEGQAPDVHKLDDLSFTAWQAPAKCEYCDQHPKYLVV